MRRRSSPRITRRASLLGAVAAVLPVGCGTEHPPAFDRSAMLSDLTEMVMLPTLRSFSAGAAALSADLAALAGGPAAAALDAVAASWRACREPWRRSRVFGLGPTQELDGNIDYTPIKEDNIETAIASQPSFTQADIVTLGTSSKGLMAIEYLVFDAEGGAAAVLARLTDAATGSQRRSYLDALGQDLAVQAAALTSAWDEGGYAREVATAGDESATFRAAKDAIDALVNQIIFVVDTTANAGIAAPLGLKTGGTPRPELEIARRSDNTLADVTNDLLGARALWDGAGGGGDGLGLSDLLRDRSASLDDDVRAAMDAALAAVAAVPPPMRTALVSAPSTLQAAFDAVIALKRLLATDVVTALGVTLSVNDNDGD
jgi:predicted lipoprotein